MFKACPSDAYASFANATRGMLKEARAPCPARRVARTAFDPIEAHVYRSGMPPKAPKPETPDFETALRDLEDLVERLEHGDLPLEESLAAFERGVLLTRACQSALKEAEQKVEILLKKAGEPAVEDFMPDEPNG
jgi:exodeoxyribonuclease VII small subunit